MTDSRRFVIALTGMPKAAKSKAALYLERRDWTVYNVSAIIKHDLRRQGIEINWRSVKEYAERIRATKGPDHLAKVLLEEIEKDSDAQKKICIDGIRSPAEIELIRNHFPLLLLVYIHSSPELRYRKLLEENGAILTRDEFRLLDSHNLELGVGHLAAMADFVILNEEYMPCSLEKQVDDLIEYSGKWVRIRLCEVGTPE